jgi:prophage regulatory protein
MERRMVDSSVPDEILRYPQVRALTGGLSRSTIWRMVRDGRFPKPLALTGRNTGWLASDIAKWQQERRAEADAHIEAA